jgi:ferritin-like metal-binding protein YciE
MFERFKTPEEVYNFKLGSALKMERTVLEMLEDNADEAQVQQVEQLFRHHHDETEQQIANLERVFAAFGWDVDDSPCLPIEALDKEGKANAKKADDSIVDLVLLSGAAATEHHEIAVYETLITSSRAMGRDDVVRLLQENLEQEQHTLEEVKRAQEQVATTAGHGATA